MAQEAPVVSESFDLDAVRKMLRDCWPQMIMRGDCFAAACHVSACVFNGEWDDYFGLEAHADHDAHPEWWQVSFRPHDASGTWSHEDNWEFCGNAQAMEQDMIALVLSGFESTYAEEGSY